MLPPSSLTASGTQASGSDNSHSAMTVNQSGPPVISHTLFIKSTVSHVKGHKAFMLISLRFCLTAG